MTRTIGIFVFDGVEVLDFAGPYEVFSCASRIGETSPFRVLTIGQHTGTLRARAGLTVLPEADFASAGELNALIVSGGVVTAELDKPEVIDWIAAMARRCDVVASVCTGAFLLARAGLLDGLEATTHGQDATALQAAHPAVRVRPGWRWIDNGAVVTSGGISAGIDMSLHLVGRMAGRELAVRTARQMEYDWNEA
jgi:transcriptional regulator GlxA family with amidase domain